MDPFGTIDLTKKLLWDLPETSREIANLFRKLECKGKSGEADRCPVARYLSRHLPERVVVGPTSVIVSNVRIMLPWSATSFIFNFDSGYYPDLVE
jgi:hypothetical protein